MKWSLMCAAESREWLFLPRKISTDTPYAEETDEVLASNVAMFVSEDFSKVDLVTVGELDLERGFSSVARIPGTELFAALKVLHRIFVTTCAVVLRRVSLLRSLLTLCRCYCVRVCVFICRRCQVRERAESDITETYLGVFDRSDRLLSHSHRGYLCHEKYEGLNSYRHWRERAV